MIIKTDIAKLFENVSQQTTIITPNRRLAATLHKKYHQAQTKSYWLTPDILPLNSWLERLWTDYLNLSVIEGNGSSLHLLSSLQEQTLWEKIVRDTNENAHLLRLSETATIAQSAYALLKQWQIDLNHPLFQSAEDYIALHRWIQKFTAICRKENWLDRAALPDYLTNTITVNKELLPQHIYLVGFTELSPQLKVLLSQCEAAGTAFTEFHLEQPSIRCERIGLADEEAEVTAIARWARAIYLKNNTAAIGCVIPKLDKMRDTVAQIFSAVFTDELTHSMPFNISAGKPLNQYPVIATALQLLALHKKSLARTAFVNLLATPFLGDADKEYINRYQVDVFLRQKNIHQVYLPGLLEEKSDAISFTTLCPQLSKRLASFFKKLDYQERAFHAWAQLFTELLLILGWPGERSLNSEEYQTVDAWMKLLASFATLDHVAAPVNMDEALQTLKKMAATQSFQPESPEAPIQVLGLLEAASLPFDYLWVAGMDDAVWPAAPNPNPFIPKSLQRELHMPHATAERELVFCSSLTEQFQQSSPHVLFSYAEKQEEIHRNISPLLQKLPSITLEDMSLAHYQSPSSHIYAQRDVENIIDASGPALTEPTLVKGGVNVLTQQALCAFKAFATHRLNAQALEETVPGLNAKERGIIVHKALELVWHEIKDQATLCQISDIDLKKLLDRSISKAMHSVQLVHANKTKYLLLEKQRLTQLINEWLQLEKIRPEFSVIFNEKRESITLNNISLTITVDRVDQLADGKKLIIDYKTGKNNTVTEWFGERLEKPQLPLYAMLDPSGTIGISFAEVTTGSVRFKGVSHYSLDIPGITLYKRDNDETWPIQLQTWQQDLTKLSDDFYQGDAQINPKDGDQTCQQCGLQSLCRIEEVSV